MRESTKNTVSMLSHLWQTKWPTADMDALLLVGEIVEAYKNGAVSPESCMEEICYIVEAKQDSQAREACIVRWKNGKSSV